MSPEPIALFNDTSSGTVGSFFQLISLPLARNQFCIALAAHENSRIIAGWAVFDHVFGLAEAEFVPGFDIMLHRSVL